MECFNLYSGQHHYLFVCFVNINLHVAQSMELIRLNGKIIANIFFIVWYLLKLFPEHAMHILFIYY